MANLFESEWPKNIGQANRSGILLLLSEIDINMRSGGAAESALPLLSQDMIL